MKEQGNLLLAIVLSLLILLGFQYFFELPRMKKEAERQEHLKKTDKNIENNLADNEEISGYLELNDALNKDERIKINASRLEGSISLKGLKIDDLTLKNYKETLNSDSEYVTLFKPSSTKGTYLKSIYISSTMSPSLAIDPKI